MAKTEFVKCRYKHCDKLHSDTSLNKEEAVLGDNGFYYHPDCYHTKVTIEEIRDLFIGYIDPTLTGKQIAMLIKVINDIVFKKNVDVDYLKYCLGYYILHKPGVLKHPGGLHYIINQDEIKNEWKKRQEIIMRQQLKQQNKIIEEKEMVEFNIPDIPTQITFKNTRPRFSSVIGA